MHRYTIFSSGILWSTYFLVGDFAWQNPQTSKTQRLNTEKHLPGQHEIGPYRGADGT